MVWEAGDVEVKIVVPGVCAAAFELVLTATELVSRFCCAEVIEEAVHVDQLRIRFAEKEGMQKAEF